MPSREYPAEWDALYAAALRAAQDGDPERALRGYDAAIALRGDHAESWYKRANALNGLGRWAAALADYDRAVALDPGYANAWCNRGVALERLGRPDDALASYKRCLVLNPDDFLAYYNRGTVLQTFERYAEALASYDRAVALNGAYAEAYVNRGNVLQALDRHEEAAASYCRAIELRAVYPEAFQALGSSQFVLRRFEAAASSFARALQLDGGFRFAAGMRRYAQLQSCDWSDLPADLLRIGDGVERGGPVCPPLAMLALVDSPALQRRAAETWVREECRPAGALGAIPPGPRADRIRIGYFSPDFRAHAVAELIAGVFEHHDRSRVESTAFAYGPTARDAKRLRLEAAFDRFIDVRQESDLQVARLSRELGIDIAIDLAGFTAHSRFRIFGLRAAPVQVGYLGYPGTTGASCIDYIVADRTLIPDDAQRHYSEKIIYLPSFQANDSRRPIAARMFGRDELGLPAQGFVFCCCNANYKITPATFDSWMRILGRVPGSSLLLVADSAAAVDNLRREAIARGIGADRLAFVGRLPVAEYLARYRTADLFLDTLPFNGGTTASDALWAGLPVLTRAGASFAARMAASLLQALGLPELVTSTATGYEELAVQLATDPERLAQIRQRLARNRLTMPLFDTAAFTRSLEAAYELIWRRHRDGLPPGHIAVDAC